MLSLHLLPLLNPKIFNEFCFVFICFRCEIQYIKQNCSLLQSTYSTVHLQCAVAAISAVCCCLSYICCLQLPLHLLCAVARFIFCVLLPITSAVCCFRCICRVLLTATSAVCCCPLRLLCAVDRYICFVLLPLHLLYAVATSAVCCCRCRYYFHRHHLSRSS